MKKILVIVLILLMGFLTCQALISGVEIGNFKILSIQQISKESNNIDTQIESLKEKIDKDYPAKDSELKTKYKTLEAEKEKYLQLSSVSTESELQRANKRPEYVMQFLWIRLGNHAKDQGVKMSIGVVNGSSKVTGYYDLNFTITGQYVRIINFITAIENDTKLEFKIEEFKLKPQTDNTELQATFKVKDIGFDLTTTQMINTTTETQAQTNNSTEENTTTNNTTTNSTNNTSSGNTTINNQNNTNTMNSTTN